MKIPRLITALFAGAAAACGYGSMPGASVPAMEIKTVSSAPRQLTRIALAESRRRVSKGGIALGRVGGNQRQKRKDRRRAHAAGQRHAFSR